MAADDWVDASEAPAPTWLDTAKSAGQTVDDAVRAAANAVTFGMADRLAGLAGGEGTAAEVAKSEAARARSPYASIAGDVGGAVALPGFGAEALAARLGGRALARAGAYGLTGAATGAAQGAGGTYTGELPDYVRNAAIGGALGGVLGSAGGAAFGRGSAIPKAEVPTQAELWAAKNTGYTALGQSGARYEQPALAARGDEIERQLLAERYNWRDSPGTWRGIEEARGQAAPGQLNTGYGGVVDPGNIDFIVKGLNRIPKTEATATDRESARIVKRALNDFVENPPPGAVLPGTEEAAAQASTLARNARGDYAAYKRVQAIDELINNARNTAGATNSGLNLQAELRKGVRTFVKEKRGESPASKAGFIDPEIASLTQYTRPEGVTNTTRYLSNALGGGGGVSVPWSILGYGALAGGGRYAQSQDPETSSLIGLGGAVAAPLAGLALRRYGNRRADLEIQQMRDMIARRSPLYDYRASQSGMQPGPGYPGLAASGRNAVTQALLKQLQQRGAPDTTTDWQ